MKIMVTAHGADRAIIQTDLKKAGRSYPEGTVLTVPKYVGDFCIRRGVAIPATEEPSAEEPMEQPEEPEEASSGEPAAETATAEPAGEEAVQPRPRRRKGV